MKLLSVLLLITCVRAYAAEPITKYLSPIEDLHLKTSIVSRDMGVLKKISGEFAQSYRFGGSEAYYKEPLKLRLVSKAGLVNITYIINGNKKSVKAGIIRRSMDVTNSPGQRQSANTFGLLTPSWVSLLNVTSKGTEKLNGRSVAVYEGHYKAEPKGTYFMLYVDTERKALLRQQQIHGDGRLKVTYEYSDFVNRNGVWIPTGTEVFNAEGKRGAVTKTTLLSVNSNLPDSLFSV